jgi:anti-sigma factor RsiW
VTHPSDLLSAYLDGELAAADLAAVARHLDGCAACGEELHAVASARVALRSLPMLEPPADALANGVVPIGTAPSAWRHRLVRATAAAAAAVVIVAGVVVASSDEPDPVVDLSTMTDRHVARVFVEPGISTIRGPVGGP